ncbi:hypothetical protein B0H63DRAFT_474222 [Podospora didyma]|uniref:Uncharacterized protein n=1 Tax=Podospora didyma TaxID=330526 RepID=A0AAE0NRC6_9PEZI|nr:hypothetical protein B0H63DRAFT_474222 [Podospora didyma]
MRGRALRPAAAVATTTLLVPGLLLSRVVTAQTEDPDHGVRWQYPSPEGLIFNTEDTINVQYTSTFPSPHLFTFCNSAEAGKGPKYISQVDAAPFNGTTPVWLNWTSATTCYFNLRPGLEAGHGSNGVKFNILGFERAGGGQTFGLDHPLPAPTQAVTSSKVLAPVATTSSPSPPPPTTESSPSSSASSSLSSSSSSSLSSSQSSQAPTASSSSPSSSSTITGAGNNLGSGNLQDSNQGTDGKSNQQASNNSSGLSTGASAGVGIGAAIGVIALAGGAFAFYRRRRQQQQKRKGELDEVKLVGVGGGGGSDYGSGSGRAAPEVYHPPPPPGPGATDLEMYNYYQRSLAAAGLDPNKLSELSPHDPALRHELSPQNFPVEMASYNTPVGAYQIPTDGPRGQQWGGHELPVAQQKYELPAQSWR